MRSKKTLAELTAWLSWDHSGAKPDAQTLANFLGIELAEPEPPVGQRRRSPDGVEVIKTDDGTNSWRRYRGKACLSWFTGAEVAGWEVITDAPECDREHLPEGHVPITFNGWSDDDLRVAARVVGSGALGASIRAERARRGANWEDATTEENAK